MKNFIKMAGIAVVYGAALNAGFWLWDNYIEDKVENLVDKLAKKGESK